MSSSRVGMFFMTICATIAMAVVDSSFFSLFQQQITASQQYVETLGTILESRIQYHGSTRRGGGRDRVAVADIRYSYSVNGAIFESSRYRYFWGDRSDQAVVNGLPEGKEVPVFYNLQQPGDAVLSATVDANDWRYFSIIVGLNIVLVVVWLLLIFWHPRRAPKQTPVR